MGNSSIIYAVFLVQYVVFSLLPQKLSFLYSIHKLINVSIDFDICCAKFCSVSTALWVYAGCPCLIVMMISKQNFRSSDFYSPPSQPSFSASLRHQCVGWQSWVVCPGSSDEAELVVFPGPNAHSPGWHPPCREHGRDQGVGVSSKWLLRRH